MLITKCEVQIEKGDVLTGDAFVYFGCNELIAIHIDLKSNNVKIVSIKHDKYPFISLSTTCGSSLTKITLLDYPGYKFWACNVYKNSLRFCIFKD